MEYTMKAGVLYGNTSKEVLAKIKGAMVGPEKKIYHSNDVLSIKTDIRYPDPQMEHTGDVRNREYIMVDGNNDVLAIGKPGYAQGDDPDVVGWPICRMPRVDHAMISIQNQHFLLTMNNSQNYSLWDDQHKEILRIMHKGLSGGWRIEDNHGFAFEVICGLFSFCRYIEQENEFLIV